MKRLEEKTPLTDKGGLVISSNAVLFRNLYRFCVFPGFSLFLRTQKSNEQQESAK